MNYIYFMLEFISVNELVITTIILFLYYINQELTYKKKQFIRSAKEDYYKILNSEEYKVGKTKA